MLLEEHWAQSEGCGESQEGRRPRTRTDGEREAAGIPGVPAPCLGETPSILGVWSSRASLGGRAGRKGRGHRTVRSRDVEGNLFLLTCSRKDCLPPSLCFSRKWRLAEEKRPSENISTNLCCSSREAQSFGDTSGTSRGQDEAGLRLESTTTWEAACWIHDGRTLAVSPSAQRSQGEMHTHPLGPLSKIHICLSSEERAREHSGVASKDLGLMAQGC